jgi:hypothetical protein
LVLLRALLKRQQYGRHTLLCVVHLPEFFTYSSKLSTLLSNGGCHSSDALQQFLVSRVGGGCCQQVSIVGISDADSVIHPLRTLAPLTSGKVSLSASFIMVPMTLPAQGNCIN